MDLIRRGLIMTKIGSQSVSKIHCQNDLSTINEYKYFGYIPNQKESCAFFDELILQKNHPYQLKQETQTVDDSQSVYGRRNHMKKTQRQCYSRRTTSADKLRYTTNILLYFLNKIFLQLNF